MQSKLMWSVVLATLCLAVIFGLPFARSLYAQTAHNITLIFNASTTPGVNYNMYRAMVTGGPYTKLNATPFSALTYTDASGVGGTKYFYVETAICTAACPAGVSGESGFSNEASATFLGAPAPGAALQAVSN